MLFSASQKDLQATLDKHLFDDLFASFGIRDQARLTALSHPSGTSSGWLKAIPRVGLGLAIPGPEFVMDYVYGWVFLCFRSLSFVFFLVFLFFFKERRTGPSWHSHPPHSTLR